MTDAQLAIYPRLEIRRDKLKRDPRYCRLGWQEFYPGDERYFIEGREVSYTEFQRVYDAVVAEHLEKGQG